MDITLNNRPFLFCLSAKRHVPWKELPNANHQISLFYDECTWGVFGVADIEHKEWQKTDCLGEE